MANIETPAAIISTSTGKVVAIIKTPLKNGTLIRYGYDLAYNPMFMRRIVVNTRVGKISRAKKNLAVYTEDFARDINDQFYIY